MKVNIQSLIASTDEIQVTMTLTMTTAQDDELSVSNQSYWITLNLSIIFYLLIKTAYYVIAAIAPRCNYTKKS